jgi:hypothetical protein
MCTRVMNLDVEVNSLISQFPLAHFKDPLLETALPSHELSQRHQHYPPWHYLFATHLEHADRAKDLGGRPSAESAMNERMKNYFVH